MKVLIHKQIHSKLQKLAKKGNIKIEDLTNALFEKMLGNHHEELKEIIERVKMKK